MGVHRTGTTLQASFLKALLGKSFAICVSCLRSTRTMGGPTFDYQKPTVKSGSSGRHSLDHLMPNTGHASRLRLAHGNLRNEARNWSCDG
jgi:hypothetical protein